MQHPPPSVDIDKYVPTTTRFIDLRVGGKLILDSGRITISLESKTGQLARLRVEAPGTVSVTQNQSTVQSLAAKGIAKLI
jgi:hypothetical protein